jgi:hypothetical protein
MLQISRESLNQPGSFGAPVAQRYMQVALGQRLTAEKATLPRVREQLLRSAEKWEFLAHSYDSELELL